MISALVLARGLRRDCVSGLYEGVEGCVGSGLSPLLVILALVWGWGLRRDCVSGLYEGVGVDVGGVFSPLLVISALVRGRRLCRDCVWGERAGVGECVFFPTCDLGAVSRAGFTSRLCFGSIRGC